MELTRRQRNACREIGRDNISRQCTFTCWHLTAEYSRERALRERATAASAKIEKGKAYREASFEFSHRANREIAKWHESAGSLSAVIPGDLETPENQRGRKPREWAVPVLLAYSPFLTHQGREARNANDSAGKESPFCRF